MKKGSKSKPRNVYTTANGYDVPISPISLEELRKAEVGVAKHFKDEGEPLDPPTYDVEVAGGDTQTFPMDEESVLVEGDEEETAKRQALWDAHQDALQRMKSEQNRVSQVIFMEGIQVELPSDTSWEDRQRNLYIEIPEEPDEKYWHYLSTVVFKSPNDFVSCIEKILRISAQGIVPEEELDGLISLFRDTVQGTTE